jgi:2-polyprenyl-3-methyl-5-hydroxy-6-metoxy-1,4-benzoquinol methylase
MISLLPTVNQLPETNLFCVPPPNSASEKELEDSLTEEIQNIYHFCLNNKEKITGYLFLTFVFDFSKKKIEILDSQGEKAQVHKIKAISYAIDDSVNLISLKWTFELNDRREIYHTPRWTNALPITLCNGMEYERIFSKGTALPLLRSKDWDNWEQSLPEYVQHYAEIIHPKILDTIGKIYALNPQRKLNILDLGGGSGRLAERILQQDPEKIKRILVTDKSLALLRKAKSRAKNYPEKMFTKYLDLNEQGSLSPSKFFKNTDLIVLCGVAAFEVLTKKTAKKVIKECTSIIKENGYIVVISITPALLNSEEYEALGLKVFNKSFTFYLKRGFSHPPYATNDFYVLQKSKNTKT